MNQLSGALANGIKAVGYIPNEDRPAFKMAIHEVCPSSNGLRQMG